MKTCLLFLSLIIFCSCAEDREATPKTNPDEAPFVNIPKENTDSALEYMQQAQSKALNKEFKEAEKLFGMAINLDPYLSEVYSLRADLFVHQKKYEKALEDYNKAAELSPNKAVVFYERGTVHLYMGHVDEGLDDYSTSIKLDPGKAAAKPYTLRGCYYLSKNDTDAAMHDFDKAVLADPRLAEAYYFRSTAKVMLNDRIGACMDLNESAKLGFKQAKEQLRRSCK